MTAQQTPPRTRRVVTTASIGLGLTLIILALTIYRFTVPATLAAPVIPVLVSMSDDWQQESLDQPRWTPAPYVSGLQPERGDLSGQHDDWQQESLGQPRWTPAPYIAAP